MQNEGERAPAVEPKRRGRPSQTRRGGVVFPSDVGVSFEAGGGSVGKKEGSEAGREGQCGEAVAAWEETTGRGQELKEEGRWLLSRDETRRERGECGRSYQGPVECLASHHHPGSAGRTH